MKIYYLIICILVMFCHGCTSGTSDGENPVLERQMNELYGTNERLHVIPKGQPVAVTCTGTFVGKDSMGVSSFKGIPYAKPPVGKLRWKEPVLPDSSSEIRTAYFFGKSSMQTRTDMMLASYYKQGEDCLTLNIWKSDADTTERKPVMVFIHGGSFAWDGPSSPIYECHNMAKNYPEIVWVTITYRLGIMGFIDFSEIEGGEEYASSVNLGLLDQIAALKWIQQNIQAFGGDPGNVTLFGESAGAACVSLLPLINESKGLFRRVIAESGSIGLTQKAGKGVELTNRIMKLTGSRNMNDLLRLKEDELYAIYPDIENNLNMPTCDGKILPLDTYAAWTNGAAMNIDVLTGTNSHEASLWINELGGLITAKVLMPYLYQTSIYGMEDQERERIERIYQDWEEEEVLQILDFLTETSFRAPMLLMADKHADAGGNTYVYLFNYPSAIPYYGACHGIELGYVFNNSHLKTLTGDSVSTTLVKAIPEMWVNFAKTGNPSTSDIQIPRYNSVTRNMVKLDNEITIEQDIHGRKREVFEPLAEKYGSYPNMPRTWKAPIIWETLTGVFLVLSVVTISLVIVVRKKVARIREAKNKVFNM